MTRLKINLIASGSKGNCIALTYKNTTILLDVGVSREYISKHFIGNNSSNTLNQIKGVVVSHLHGDHAKYLDDWEATTDIITPSMVKEKKSFNFHGFKLTPFLVMHDVLNYGYIIKIKNFKLLWFTDAAAFPKFKPQFFDLVMMEANHTKAQFLETIVSRDPKYYHWKRHMEVSELGKNFNEKIIPYNKDVSVVLLHHTTYNRDIPISNGSRRQLITDMPNHIRRHFEIVTKVKSQSIRPELFYKNSNMVDNQNPGVVISCEKD